ncbi:unnamed protein product [Euphydryas editha]|uniref:Uncharacterized protein n=1 Tax=Euphydryas editha TaxID=104508 RepID=A0AAU9U8K8_EUPED|nr:unnamed protein product [Euphydryas editha]
MPPTKDHNSKYSYGRSFSSDMVMSAKVYHPATNLLPPTPPQSPTGISTSFPNRTTVPCSRQNSQTNGKY